MPKFRAVERDDDTATGRRVFWIGALFACSFGLLVCRAMLFQMSDDKALRKVADRQYQTAMSQSTKRGKILDSAGRELAIDVTVESIYASPRDVKDPAASAQKLSKTLGVDRRKLFEKLSASRKFAWVKRRASEEEAKAVMDQNIEGIFSMHESSRSYPGKHIASSILGAVGFDAEPLGGVELAYNDLISARKKGRDVKRDARGHLYLSPTGDSDELKVSNVWLTIDKTLQYTAERELAKAVERSRAKGGSAIVVDVNSGAILAMANIPTFDPNDYEKYGILSWKNRSIADSYEPGSTFKTIIVASALDSGLVTIEDVFDCENGSIKIGNKVVHDAHRHGKLSVADIIKVSSNVGAYKVEQRMGQKRSYDYIRAFGFGALSGVDLPGESAGLLSSSDKWSEIQFATIAFGQGVAATPLQMIMAFAAIANGGALFKPYIVKRIASEDGNELYAGRPEVTGRPIGPAAAKAMAGLLERVTQKGGTGTLAASLEYPVAGKTGTAQKADPRTGGYAQGRYYSSFLGFAPADRPKIAVYVGIDEPGGGMYYGGLVAAPAFREIVDGTLHYLKVPGKTVVASGGDSGAREPAQSAEELAFVTNDGEEKKQVVPQGEQSWKIPDFTGLTMKGVLDAASEAEISWKFVGSGIAIRQTPEAGSVVAAGAECEVEFRPVM